MEILMTLLAKAEIGRMGLGLGALIALLAFLVLSRKLKQVARHKQAVFEEPITPVPQEGEAPDGSDTFPFEESVTPIIRSGPSSVRRSLPRPIGLPAIPHPPEVKLPVEEPPVSEPAEALFPESPPPETSGGDPVLKEPGIGKPGASLPEVKPNASDSPREALPEEGRQADSRKDEPSPELPAMEDPHPLPQEEPEPAKPREKPSGEKLEIEEDRTESPHEESPIDTPEGDSPPGERINTPEGDSPPGERINTPEDDSPPGDEKGGEPVTGRETDVPPPPEPPAARAVPAVPVEQAITPTGIVCLICGRSFLNLRLHLQRKHKMTPEAFLHHFGLDDTFPLSLSAATKAAEKAQDTS
ncbi:MAG: MucR family transcriptional regulator [Magnetococcales bacterium]|nr:MucR family transcriptional regulator [Magnetococcales bacterium]